MKTRFLVIGGILFVATFCSTALCQNTSEKTSSKEKKKQAWRVVVTDNVSAEINSNTTSVTQNVPTDTTIITPKSRPGTAANVLQRPSENAIAIPPKDSVSRTKSANRVVLNSANSVKDKDVRDNYQNDKKNVAEKPELPKKSISEWEKTWSVLARFSASFDTNLEHDPVGVKAFGFVPSMTAGYQLRSGAHRLKFIYSTALPRYTRDTDLNRFGNYFAAAYRYSIGKWSFETNGEASLKGTNDDRETNNQFTLTETIGYRFDNRTKLSVFGAYRLRRFPVVDADRNAVNPMLGLKFSRSINGKVDWNLGYRYDENRAINPRQNYVRSTYKTGFDLLLNSTNLIGTEISYRPRRYIDRLVDVGDLEVLRRDEKWTFDLMWKRNITEKFGIQTGYQYENQTSNDLDKLYRNHQIVFSIFYHWGNGEAIEP
jgi:hypothetical protein